jgi:formylglycine-generating enzyme
MHKWQMMLVAIAACADAASGFGSRNVGARPAPEKFALLEVTGESSDAENRSECPSDMAYVDTSYCRELSRECIEEEHEEPNHLKICHKFREGAQKCATAEEHRQFCIDKYEYPNIKGAHPAWNATWYEAQATCKSKSKRLCFQSEWTAACEGSTHTPFPYGWNRSHKKCNLDNQWINPHRGAGGFLFAAKEPEVRFLELSRLDRSVPSGSMEDCQSDFGVADLTGNFDEWTINDEKPKEQSRFAALKGGAWGHVRNQCRPSSHGHMPEERYYFWSFRCCKDAEGAPEWQPRKYAENEPAPEVAPHDYFPDPVTPLNPPGPSELKYNWKLDDYTKD